MADLITMLAASGGVERDSEFSNVSLLLHGDGTNGAQNNTFIDSSSNNFTITRNGNVTQGSFSPFPLNGSKYDPAVHGGSGYFDGSGDYLTVPDSNAFYFGSGDFTIEAWIYPKTYGSSGNNVTRGVICGQWDLNNYAFELYLKSDGSVNCPFNYNPAIADLASPASTVPLNAWTHVAVVRNGTVFTLYVNGNSVDTATSSSGVINSNEPIAIGRNSDANIWFFNGFISNLRIAKGTALYTSNFTPPTAPLTAVTNTSLLLNFTNAGIVDSTAKNNLETVGNAQIDTTTKKFGTGSMEFDGSGDYLDISSSTEFGFNTGAFTIEFWLYLNTVSGTQILLDMRSGVVDQVAISLYMINASPRLYVSDAAKITGGNINTGQWYHIALTRSGTNTKLFVDGVQSGSTYTDSNNYLDPRPLRIGTTNDGASGIHLNGYIDDLRITKGVARYTANFTPPTKAFPDQ